MNEMKIGETMHIICVEDLNQDTKKCNECCFMSPFYGCTNRSLMIEKCHRCSRTDNKNVHFEIKGNNFEKKYKTNYTPKQLRDMGIKNI